MSAFRTLVNRAMAKIDAMEAPPNEITLHTAIGTVPKYYTTPRLGLEYFVYNIDACVADGATRRCQNVCVFTGNTRDAKQANIHMINRYCALIGDRPPILKEPAFSTLTITGKFENLRFNESTDFDMLRPSDNRIIKMKCNYGEYYHPTPAAVVDEKVRNVSARRARVQKMHHVRRVHGDGKSFGSQITFHIWNNNNKVLYKIKLFRNGKFQIPGIRRFDMLDVIQPLVVLGNALRECFVDESIYLAYVVPVMLNCSSKAIENNTISFDLNACEDALLAERASEISLRHDAGYDTNAAYTRLAIDKIAEFASGSTFGDLSEIQNNPERYFGVIVRFRRPMPWNAEKRCTIKLLKTLKLNFDGVNNMYDCLELYCWFTLFYYTHYNTIVQQMGTTDDTTSDDGYESLYDSDATLRE